jgi:hypothetical protein
MNDLLSKFSFGDVLAFIGIATAFVIYFLQRQRKALSYRVFAVTRVAPFDFDAPSPAEHDIAVEYVNSGNVPLLASDFLSPIVTDFPDSDVVVSSRRFISAFANNPPSQVTHVDSKASLELQLLNPGESARAEFRVREFKGSVRVRARIVGVNTINNLEVTRVLWWQVTTIAMFYLGYVVNRFRQHELISHFTFFVLIIPFAVMSVVHLIRTVRNQQMRWAFRPGGNQDL